MKEMPTHRLKEGMVIGEDVLTKGGQRILTKGKVLTLQSIMRLSFYSIKSVQIISPDSAMEEDEPLSAAPKAYSQEIKSSPKFHSFQVDHSKVLNAIQENFENYVNNDISLDCSTLLSNVKALFRSCKTSLELFNMLHNMHSSEDSIYAHCLNVSLICRQLGKWLKLDAETLDLLTLCGLLHDIGKVKIPTEILNKPGKYTDEEFTLVKMHTQHSYDLLKNLPLDPHVCQAALYHHERCDGSGYPMGLKLDEVDEFALAVAIADVYDAMTTARPYRAPLCPFQVIDRFEKEGLQKYHPKYILTFLRQIAGTYQNHRILLSDGRSATIVMLNKQYLSKPIVKLDNGICIDLSTEHNLAIQAVV